MVDSAGNEISKRDARIRELEAEVERMRPVVEAAQGWARGGASQWLPLLAVAIIAYERDMAQLAKEHG